MCVSITQTTTKHSYTFYKTPDPLKYGKSRTFFIIILLRILYKQRRQQPQCRTNKRKERRKKVQDRGQNRSRDFYFGTASWSHVTQFRLQRRSRHHDNSASGVRIWDELSCCALPHITEGNSLHSLQVQHAFIHPREWEQRHSGYTARLGQFEQKRANRFSRISNSCRRSDSDYTVYHLDVIMTV